MKYGRIRIEDGNLVFIRHMMINNLPCEDILWAYMRREEAEGEGLKRLASPCLVVLTRKKKRYQFPMSEREASDCIQHLRMLNPRMAAGFPKGGRIRLQSLNNTRDLGGLAAEDGRHIVPHRLLRSGELYHVSMADKELLLNEYSLRTVIDFRSEIEKEKKPDTIIAGVEYYHIPVLDEVMPGIFKISGELENLFSYKGDLKDLMRKQYGMILRDQYCIKQYAKFIDVLLHHKEGAALWHCGSGKDRAGIGTALLLSVLGIPEDTIREDFLRSNHYLEQELSYMQRLIEAYPDRWPPEIKKNLEAMFRVEESYLEAAFETIRTEYGSMETFFRQGLYLKPRTIEELRDKYLL